jgi:hypothetical protein
VSYTPDQLRLAERRLEASLTAVMMRRQANSAETRALADLAEERFIALERECEMAGAPSAWQLQLLTEGEEAA